MPEGMRAAFSPAAHVSRASTRSSSARRDVATRRNRLRGAGIAIWMSIGVALICRGPVGPPGDPAGEASARDPAGDRARGDRRARGPAGSPRYDRHGHVALHGLDREPGETGRSRACATPKGSWCAGAHRSSISTLGRSRRRCIQAEGTLERDLQVLAQARMDLARYRAAWDQNAIAKQQLDDQAHLVRQTEGRSRMIAASSRRRASSCNSAGSARRSPVRSRAPPGRSGQRWSPRPGRPRWWCPPRCNRSAWCSRSPRMTLTQLWGQAGPRHRRAGRGVRPHAHAPARGPGTLQTIDNQIDTTTGTVRVRAVFDNADEALFPNQFVNTRVLVKTLHGAITISLIGDPAWTARRPSCTLSRPAARTWCP